MGNISGISRNNTCQFLSTLNEESSSVFLTIFFCFFYGYSCKVLRCMLLSLFHSSSRVNFGGRIQQSVLMKFKEKKKIGDKWYLVAQLVKICLQWGRPGFDPWGGKISWRRERVPIPVFWHGEFRGLYSLWDCKELDTTEWLSLHIQC